VRSSCLADALISHEAFGVWAGTSERQRRKVRSILTKEGLLGAIGESRHLVWLEPGADREPRTAAHGASSEPLRPRKHQLDAVKAIVKEICDGGTAQVQMAMATGKTLLGPMLATELEATTTLILVPSLQLITQTAAIWQANYARPARYLAVCSDAGEMDIASTTSPNEVADEAHAAGELGEDFVVFATYHSSSVLAESGVEFALAIADEAHHLAGDVNKAFASILRGEIKAERRVYMTATPKITKRASSDGEVVGMDDSAFGKRVYKLSIDRAIAKGLIADYRIVVASVDVATFETVSRQLDTRVDPHLLAGAIAVVRGLEQYGAKSLISYHTRIERASEFSVLVGKVAELLPSGQRPAGSGFSAWLDGATSVRIRDRLLARLGDPVGWGVVSNAKALGEGVDLPNLDAIAIVDPKTSEVEVTQAIGRALRRPCGVEKTGLVIHPILLRGDPTDDDPLASVDGRSLEIVAGALRALRAHDERLAEALDQARQEAGRHASDPAYAALARRFASRLLLHHRIEFNLPGGALGELAGALAFNLVRETTSDWEERLGLLRAWLDENDRYPYQSDAITTSSGEIEIGTWVNSQRMLYRRGLVAKERCARLETLPNWSWEPRKETWERNFVALKKYVDRTGIVTPKATLVEDGVRVGQLVNTLRLAYKEHAPSMTPSRIAQMESLPGWTWNAREDMWWDAFEILKRYVASHGHAAPKGAEMFEGAPVGQWVQRQRQAIFGKDHRKIKPDQAELIRALPGWRDAVLEETWEENYALIAAYCVEHGRIPRQGYVSDTGVQLGAWCLKQRQFQRKIADDKTTRLESLPGWFWSERLSAPIHPDLIASEEPRDGEPVFDLHFRELERYIAVHGSATTRPGDMVGATDIGRWVVRQRHKIANGELSVERVGRLTVMPGWIGAQPVGRSALNQQVS
jgi:superfamily II DNA or RNA helicase